jgi:HlyD family secretion protein
MDRPIEPRVSVKHRRLLIVGGLSLVVVVLSYWTVARLGRRELAVDSSRLIVSQVSRGVLEEYVPIEGSVAPGTTVYLDVEEGGIVEKMYGQSGTRVKQGDLILSFSNTAAQKQDIETETRLLENLNGLRNSKISLTETSLILKDQLLDANYKIRDLEKTFIRDQQIMKSPEAPLSKEEFETTSYRLEYYRNKRDLLQERIRVETELQQQQSRQIDESTGRINRNLDLLTQIVDSLDVRAPVDGYLSALSAEVGQSFQRGQRLGQIDQLETLIVQAKIDQYYIGRVTLEQRGKFEFSGQSHELKITKIYPEVTDGTFHVDMAFIGITPQGLKRGQTLHVDLSLGAPAMTQIVAKGAFYRYTNGRWVYLLSADGRTARRVNVVVGRQNPEFVEVLEGLKPGDLIINSNYETFNDVDELRFDKRVGL